MEGDGWVGNGSSRADPIDACRLPPAREDNREVRVGRESRWLFFGLGGLLLVALGVDMGGVGGMRLDEKWAGRCGLGKETEEAAGGWAEEEEDG